MHAPVDIDVDPVNQTEVEVWAPGARARQQRRRETAKTISELMKQTGAGGFASANYTMLTFVRGPAAHSCTPTSLKQLAKTFKAQLDDAGFEVLEFDVGGPRLLLR